MLPIRDLNPTRRTPYVTYVLIGLNVLVFTYEVTLLFLGGAAIHVAPLCLRGQQPGQLFYCPFAALRASAQARPAAGADLYYVLT